MAELGVLVMAYGTPARSADVETFYTHIRRGRPPEPEQLADLVRRYDAIGGTSPLAARTEAQRSAIERALRERGVTGPVVLGNKHAEPFVEDGVTTLLDQGVDRVVGLVLAPHYSSSSVGRYHDRAREAIGGGVPYAAIESWHLRAPYLAFLTEEVRAGLAGLPDRTTVVFTAHSLPERVLTGDPYADHLHASAAAVARRAGLTDGAWKLGWQSAGRTPEPWRGPDILEVIAQQSRSGGSDGLLVCAQGFTSDHLEVLYDLDIEARERAGAAGLAFARTRSIDDDPSVMDDLADLVLTADPGARS